MALNFEELLSQDPTLMRQALDYLQNNCWQQAEESGFHGDETLEQKVLLWHAEVSELVEELRAGRKPGEVYYSYKAGMTKIDTEDEARYSNRGGKTTRILNKPEGVASEAADVIIRILDDCQRYGIPLWDVMAQKMAYNATRTHRHGGAKF